MSWGDHARAAIYRVHQRLAEDAPLADRVKAVDAAYPFSERAYWPYKAWLKARRAYLVHYGWKPKGAPAKAPSLLDLLPRDPATGRPLIK